MALGNDYTPEFRVLIDRWADFDFESDAPPNFGDLTGEEIQAWQEAGKAHMDAIRQKILMGQAASNAAIEADHIADAVFQVEKAAAEANMTPDELCVFWLRHQWADLGRHILARRYQTRSIVNSRDVAP